MTEQKLLDENNLENTIVHAVFRAEADPKQDEYESVCVLLRETSKGITLSFNAKDDKVVDFLELKRSEIVSIKVLKEHIEEMK